MIDLNSSSTKPRVGGCFRILGLDPAATGPTGYGVIETDGRHSTALRFGAWKIPAKRQKEALGAVLQDIHALLCHLILEFRPQEMAVENIFSALNVRTVLRLAEIRGIVLLAAAQHGLPVHSYAPREVKASITGNGNADKRHVQTMVRAMLSMTQLPEPADAADALAVALCHLQAERVRRRFGLPPQNGVANSTQLSSPVLFAGKPLEKGAPGNSNRPTRPDLTRILLSR
jgi:crossover junction endodeoxyribonuclease RuvC